MALGVVLSACTVKEAGTQAEACNGPDCQDAGVSEPASLGPPAVPAPEPAVVPEAGAPKPSTDAGPSIAFPICAGACLPDDALSCADFDPDDELDVRALYSDADERIFSLRQLMDTGRDAGVSETDASAVGGDATENDADDGTGTDDAASNTGEEPAWSCQIDRDEGSTAVGCWVAGTGSDGAACTSTRDCQPGFACVGEARSGQCRSYCCNGASSCSELAALHPDRQYFCDERPLRSPNAEGARAIDVPVCALAEMCDLSDPFPCTDCTCDRDKTCTVVNAQGATGCRVPGEGEQGDACPCSPGHYCHPVEQTCKLLCNVERDDGVCGDSLCQATANFPPGWGLCQPVVPEAG